MAGEGWPGLFCACELCGKARELSGKSILYAHDTGALTQENFDCARRQASLASLQRMTP